MISRYALLSVAALAGCATPDLESALRSFSTDAQSANEKLASYAAPFIAKDQAQAVRYAIQRGRPSAQLSDDCIRLVAGEVTARVDACVVQPPVQPDPAHSDWLAVEGFVQEMGAYLAAFEALATVEAGTQIGDASSALINASAALRARDPQATNPLAAPIGTVIGRLTDARRYAILRAAAENADVALDRVVNDLMVLIERDRKSLASAAQVLIAADRNLDPEQRPSPSDVEVLQTAHAAYLKEVRATPIPALLSMRRAHASLVLALQRDATLSEVLSLLTDLNDLKSAVQE